MESGRGYLRCVEIKDEPRFAYRGMMLDISRHFFKKEFVYRQLDMLARYKLNVLQLHLHDTGGGVFSLKVIQNLPNIQHSGKYLIGMNG